MNKSLLQQAWTVTRISLASFPRRWARSSTVLIGTIGVITVLVALLSIARGYENVLAVSGESDNVLVLMTGANAELASTLGGEQVNLIRNAEGIRRDPQGRALASAEVFTTAKARRRDSRSSMNISVRGLEPAAFALRRGFHIVEGRAFRPGLRELIVGHRLQQQFSGLDLGAEFRFMGSTWTVVGVFEANGSVVESELWTHAPTLQSAIGRPNAYQAVYARLDEGITADRFEDQLNNDARISARVLREQDYFAEQSESLNRFVKTLGWSIALLMGLAAIFAGLNTNYANVLARTRELATFGALGFRHDAILVSVMAESLLLALAAALIGGGLTYALFDGYTTSTLFFSHNYSQVVFSFDVTPGMLALAGGLAVLIGVLGSAYPAWTVTHQPITSALAVRK